jgi:hypothetical protein
MTGDDDQRLRELSNQLRAQRPAPHPAFRGRLYRRLAGHGFPKGRPAHLWPLAGAFAAGGAALLAAAAALV